MAYNPYLVQVGGNSLQGGANNLQGGGASGLQGGSVQLQGSQPAPSPAPTQKKPVVYGNQSATPAKKDYVDSLMAYKYADDPTVYGNYNGNPNYAFTSEAEFKKAGGDFGRVTTKERPSASGSYGFMDGNSYNSNGGLVTPTQQSTLNMPNASTTPNTPQVDQLAGYKDAYAKYIAALNPSTEVSGARQKYLDFVASAESGIAGLEGQGRGIPLALVRGQQEKLGRQSEITAKRLQGDVELAEMERQGRQQQAQARLEYEKSLYDMNKPPAPIEVSAGNTLIDPRTGKVVYQAPEKQGTIDYPSSYKEYLLTTNNPTPEGFNEWLTYDANRKRSITNVSGGGNGLTPYQELNAILNIQGKLSTQTADARDAVNRYSQADTAWKQYQSKQLSKNAVEQIVVNNFNKILDPASVVREGEYARSAQGQSLLNRIDGLYYKVARGGSLSDSELKGLIDGAGILVQRYEQEIASRNQQAINTANQFGLPSNLIGVGGGTQQPAGNVGGGGSDPAGIRAILNR